MSIEKIDQSSDTNDSFGTLVNEVIGFLNNSNSNIKERLYIERKLRKYQDTNSQDWLLNLIIAINLECNKIKINSIKINEKF